MEGRAALGNLLPILDAELWAQLESDDDWTDLGVDEAAPSTWADVQGFDIAPPQPGEWTYDPTAWVRAHDLPEISMEARMRNAGGMVGRVATLPLAVPALLANSAIQSFGQAVTAPQRMAEIVRQYGGDWYAAERDPRMAAEGLDFAGALSLGPFARAATTPVRHPEVSLPNGPHPSYSDPGAVQTSNSVGFAPTWSRPRAFDEDYPNGAEGHADATGALRLDRNGRVINPNSILVGRRMVGGAYEPITPAEFVSFTTRSIGAGPEARTAAALPRGAVGVYRMTAGPNGPERSIGILDTLAPPSAFRVGLHEGGHLIEDLAGPIRRVQPGVGTYGVMPTAGLVRQLRTIYHDLNDPSWRRGRPTRPGLQWGPEQQGYLGESVDRELWSEAGRAYLEDPNYINEVAPDVAQAIRDHVNTDPFLSQIIHFNAGGLPLPVGAPFPGTLQQVRLPGGAPVSTLPDLLGQAMLNAPPAVRSPLGPVWAAEYQAAYQDPNSPQWAARMALEAQQQAARVEAERLERERLEWERAVREGRAA